MSVLDVTNIAVNGINLYAYCLNNPVNDKDTSGNFGFLLALLIAACIGAVIGGGIEIGMQISENGWNPASWNWAQIGLSTLGGAVAGAISALPLPGYLGTFILGGIGSVVGGLISGGVTDWKSATIMFGIGGIGNVVGKAVSSLINSVVTKHSTKVLNNYIFEELSLNDLVGVSSKNINSVYKNFAKHAIKLISYANGLFVKTNLYTIINSSISSFISGW